MSVKPADLERIAEKWEQAGLPAKPVLPIIERTEQRLAELSRQRKEAEAEAHSALADVVEKVAAGKLTLAEAAKEHARRQAIIDDVSSSQHWPRLSAVHDRARAKILKSAVEELRPAIVKHLDRLPPSLLEVCGPVLGRRGGG